MKAWLANTTCQATGATRGQRSRYSPTDMNMANASCRGKLTPWSMAWKNTSARACKAQTSARMFQRCV
eukprot:2762050-Lingulodinium_polyedra.AAC.1